MTNLAITTVCNLQCPYCFTADHTRVVGDSRRYVTLEDFAKQLDYLDRSGIEEVRLLGGEPTLHPQFTELVAMAAERRKKIIVFSNGIMRSSALACLENLPPSACFVLININSPQINPPELVERQKQVLCRLGQRAMPGFNIYRPDDDFYFLLDIIRTTGCKPHIRFGMAQPCLSGENTCIRPHQYRYIAEIIAFARDAAACGAVLEFDCGFVRCMFSDEELEFLRKKHSAPGWHCNPILDVNVHGQVIHCYPLAAFGMLPLDDEATASHLRSAFMAQTAAYRQSGVFPECAGCLLKQRGECSGGCLAVTMRRFRHSAFQLDVEPELAT